MNIHPTSFTISQEDREKNNGHQCIVIWLTGLSGSGKTSISKHLEHLLFDQKINCFPLDGDNIRTGLNSDLNFSPNDRSENIRRIAEVAKLIMQSGNVVISSFISPFEKDRTLAKSIIGEHLFFEVFIDTPIDICKKRDPKGLYKKAALGEIKDFTGIDSPYETPKKPALSILTTNKSISECSDEILKAILPLLRLK